MICKAKEAWEGMLLLNRWHAIQITTFLYLKLEKMYCSNMIYAKIYFLQNTCRKKNGAELKIVCFAIGFASLKDCSFHKGKIYLCVLSCMIILFEYMLNIQIDLWKQTFWCLVGSAEDNYQKQQQKSHNEIKILENQRILVWPIIHSVPGSLYDYKSLD